MLVRKLTAKVPAPHGDPPRTSVREVSCSNAVLYPSGTYIIPWWVNVDIAASAVLSCPPPGALVEINIPLSLLIFKVSNAN